MFEDFVRSGDLSPDDLVYDVETSSWAPSRTHPIVLEIEYEKEDAEAHQADDAAEGEGESADESEEGPIGLSLAPAQEVEEPASEAPGVPTD